MPFCPNCGTATEGRFCAKCGAPVNASANPNPAGAPPPYQPAGGAIAVAGLEDNVAGALCYLLGIITGIIFLVLEPYNKRPFVRFHAFQSVLLSAAWIVVNIGFSIMMMPLHMWYIWIPLRALLGIACFVLWLFCMYKAYNRELFQIPIIGPIAAQQAGGR